MESVASNSPSPDHHPQPQPHRAHPGRFRPTQPIADRIVRALRHRLHLLHRPDAANFYVLGATGNVYAVTLSTTPTCSCPDRTTPCKHILFVLLRVLGVPLDDSCLRRRTLRPCQLTRLLSTPISPETLAGARTRERFHQVFNSEMHGKGWRPVPETIELEDGTSCPVCLEEMVKEDKVVACGTCRNALHENCLVMWKRSRGRRSPATCVICRARWRDRMDQQERYLNLAAYVNEHDDGILSDQARQLGGVCGD